MRRATPSVLGVVLVGRVTVRVGLSGESGALPQLRQLGVAQCGLVKRLLERGGRLRHRVQEELEGRREPDTQLTAHHRTQSSLGGLEGRGRVGPILVAAIDGVDCLLYTSPSPRD